MDGNKDLYMDGLKQRKWMDGQKILLYSIFSSIFIHKNTLNWVNHLWKTHKPEIFQFSFT